MPLLADRVSRPDPFHELRIDLLGSFQPEMVHMVGPGKGVDPIEARVFPPFRQNEMAAQGGLLHGHRHEGHAHMKGDPRLLGHHFDRTTRLNLFQQAGKQEPQSGWLAREMIFQRPVRAAEMGLIAAGK